MTANTIASRKAKGRRAAQEARDTILTAAKEWLQADDVKVTSSSVTGEDLALSPKARDIFPFVFEVKCQEALNFWRAIAQAASHVKGTHWHDMVVFRRNGEPLRAIVDFKLLCELLAENWRYERLVHDNTALSPSETR